MQQGKVNKNDFQRLMEELRNINSNNNLVDNAENNNGIIPSNADIMRELVDIKKDINEILELKETVKVMHNELNTAYDIINNQMRFMEIIDSKERDKNMIITGIKEDVNATLVKQVYDVIIATGYTNDSFKLNEEQGNLGLFIGDEQLSVKRLGQLRADANPERPRAILVQVPSKSLRDSIVGCANTLKGKEPYKKIYLKSNIVR